MKMMKFTIGKKLASAFAIIIVIIIGFGLYTVNKITSETKKGEKASSEANIAIKSIDPATQSISSAAKKQVELGQKMKSVTIQMNQVNNQIKEVQEISHKVKTAQVIDNKITKIIFSIYEMTKYNKQYVATGDGSYMSQHNKIEKEMLRIIDEIKTTNPKIFSDIIDRLKLYKKALKNEEDAIIEDNKELSMQISITQADIQVNAIIGFLNGLLEQSSQELSKNIDKSTQLGNSANMSVSSANKVLSNITVVLNEGKKIVEEANLQINDGQTKILDANKKVTETTENLKAASKVILSICIVVVIICIALAIIFPAMLSKPIRIISDMVMDIAKGEGDLTKRLSVMSKDEIGDMATGFNQFVGNLQNIIREISNVEQSLSGIIEDIKVSCGELNNGVLKQDEALGITSDLMSKMQTGFEEARNNIASLASAVQENSATMEQMIKSLQAAGENTQKLTGSVGTVSSSITQIATGIQTISTNAKKLGDTVNSTASAIEENIVTLQSITKNIQGANDNAKNMSVEAEKGDAAVSGTIKGFKEIEGALKTQIEIINGLENKSKEIDTIVKVISDIAGQTNLLALNAAIEAARAGEHGKGFSVVADEVRKLAEQTGEATKKIGTLIKGIQEETRKAVESSDITNIKMNEGANLVNTAGDALKGILSSVITVTTAMNEITCLMVEQDKTNQSLSSAVTEMQSLTEQVVTSTIQQGESSKLIIHESTKMNDLTNNVSASIIQLMDAGSNILSTVRKMSDRANEVNVMIDKQMESVSTVVNSSKTVKETSESVGTEGDKLNNIAENLVENADLLKKYVNQFKIGTVELAQEQEELNKKVKAKKLAENRLKNKKTAKIVEEQPEDGGSNENTDLIIDDNDSDEKVMKSVKPTTKYSAKKQVNEKQIQPETKKNISGKQQEKELTARERLRMKAGRMN